MEKRKSTPRKSLPHNDEAEKAVLGAMIRSSSKLSDGFASLTEDDFYPQNENHIVIFRALKKLYDKSIPVDTQTLLNELSNANDVETSGGVDYLLELADSIVTFSNFDHYVQIVQEQSILRRYLQKIEDIQKQYFSSDIGDVTTFINTAEKDLDLISDERKVSDFKTAKQVSTELADTLSKLKPASTDDTIDKDATPTGYIKLNQLTHGFHKGEFIVVAARPGVGKTAFALNLAYNAVKRNNKAVAYFSLEMPASQLFTRLVSMDSRVPLNTLKSGFKLDQNNNRLKISESCKTLADMKIYVDETAGVQLLDLVAKVKNLYNREPDLQLIVVDYIGLVRTQMKVGDARQLEIQYISQTLKKLALDIKVPVIGVCQLNRKVEERPGGEPQLSDLRESGSIEQDADIVILLHEPKITVDSNKGKTNLFDNNANKVNELEDQVAKKEGGPDATIVNAVIAKNRSGQQGTAPLLFSKNIGRFYSPTTETEKELQGLEKERISYISRD